MWRDAVRGGSGASLRVKLVAVTLCLLAAGAAVIVAVGASALHGQLTRQAGVQLRAYVRQLTSHSLPILGTTRDAPLTTAPFYQTGTAGGTRRPGTAGAVRAIVAPNTAVSAVAGVRAVSLELRDASGQLLLSVGPGSQPGQSLPRPFAPVPRRTGVLFTVPGVGGEYLVMAEPVHFTARRLVFGYGADDFAVTSGGRSGDRGTLVVGLRLAGLGQTVQRLTRLAVAVSAAVILIGGGLLWAAIRFSLRPVTQAAQTADAVAAGLSSDHGGTAAGGLAQRVPELAGGGLVRSLSTMLSQLDERFAASTDAEAAASAATGQLTGRLVAVADQLRRPISLLHGRAEHWAHHDRCSTAGADHALDEIAAEAARAEVLLDQAGLGGSGLDEADAGDALSTRLVRQDRDKPGSDRTVRVQSRHES